MRLGTTTAQHIHIRKNIQLPLSVLDTYNTVTITIHKQFPIQNK